MKKIFLLQPRQTGKTTKAIYEYIKEPNDTILVLRNNVDVKNIQHLLGTDDTKNVITSDQLINKVCGNRPKNIILDEYMYFLNKDIIYKEIQTISPENLYIFSTSNKQYNKNIFDFVKKNKVDLSYRDLLIKFGLTTITDDVEKEIHELYYNFITDEDTLLIDKNINFIKNRSDMLNILGNENIH